MAWLHTQTSSLLSFEADIFPTRPRMITERQNSTSIPQSRFRKPPRLYLDKPTITLLKHQPQPLHPHRLQPQNHRFQLPQHPPSASGITTAALVSMTPRRLPTNPPTVPVYIYIPQKACKISESSKVNNIGINVWQIVDLSCADSAAITRVKRRVR
jgi:hypothetical protein